MTSPFYNFGGVKQLSSILQHAFVEERHFVLDEIAVSFCGSRTQVYSNLAYRLNHFGMDVGRRLCSLGTVPPSGNGPALASASIVALTFYDLCAPSVLHDNEVRFINTWGV